MPQPKILAYDIETFPLETYAWGTFKQTIPLNMIKKDWAVMSFAGKWVGEDKIFYADNRRARDPRDDRAPLLLAHRLFSEADLLVAHNGNKFDVRKLRARFLIRGMDPLPPPRQVDTLLESRALFAHTSQRLEYLSNLLLEERKSQHSKYPGFELWKACLAKDPVAWQECEDYNKQDVLALEELYLKLRPWMARHPNLAVFDDTDHGPVCGKCGSHHVQQRGTRTTNVAQYARYQCQNCGSWFRGRQMLNSAEHRKGLLANIV